MKYYVFYAHKGEAEVVYEGTKEQCSVFEDALRAEIRKYDPNNCIEDCYTWSEEKVEQAAKAKARWDTLTPEQKTDIIEVDGKQYIRAIWEANNQ